MQGGKSDDAAAESPPEGLRTHTGWTPSVVRDSSNLTSWRETVDALKQLREEIAVDLQFNRDDEIGFGALYATTLQMWQRTDPSNEILKKAIAQNLHQLDRYVILQEVEKEIRSASMDFLAPSNVDIDAILPIALERANAFGNAMRETFGIDPYYLGGQDFEPETSPEVEELLAQIREVCPKSTGQDRPR